MIRRKPGTQHYSEMAGRTQTMRECAHEPCLYNPLNQKVYIHNPTPPLPDLRNTHGHANTIQMEKSGTENYSGIRQLQ